MWFWWALLSALLSSLIYTFNKGVLKAVSPTLLAWASFALNIPIVAVLAFRSGGSQVNSLFFLGAIGSVSVYSIALILRLTAIKESFLSRMAPLTAFGAVFTYILGVLFLSEALRWSALAGLLLVIIGVYVLKSEKAGKDFWKPFKLLVTERASKMFVLGMFLTAASAIFDKTSIMNSFPTNPALALLAQDVFITPMLLGVVNKREPKWKIEFKDNFWLLAVISVFYAIQTVVLFTGFSVGPVVLVTGIKEFRIPLTVLWSYLFFKDKPSKYSLMGTGIMMLGAILIAARI